MRKILAFDLSRVMLLSFVFFALVAALLFRYHIYYFALINAPIPFKDEVNEILDDYKSKFSTFGFSFKSRPTSASDYEIYEVRDEDTVLLMELHFGDDTSCYALFDNVHAKTFEYFISGCDSYAKDKNTAYYARGIDNRCEMEKMDVDLGSFTFIDKDYAQDKNGKYFKGKSITN